jgi:LacI family transcriptional regulator
MLMPARSTHTMRDVAAHAGVSPMTVSRVLRDDPNVSDHARTRVLASVAALGYRRNEAARSLRLGRAGGVIGVSLANLANPFYAELALGVEAWANDHDLRVVFADSAEDPAREERLMQDFAARRLDGVIAVPTTNKHTHLDPARLDGMPVVLAASPPSNIVSDAVLLDDFGGTWEAIGELMSQGHTKIGFLGLPGSSWTGSERFRGYSAALEEAGLEVDDRYVRRGKPTVESAMRATAQLLKLGDPPTAIFAANNRLTVGSYRALRAAAADTTLAGFDDLELADLLDRPLLLVAYDARELGRRAAELLGDRLKADGDQPAAGRRVIIPTRLVHYGAPTSRHRDRPDPAARRQPSERRSG